MALDEIDGGPAQKVEGDGVNDQGHPVSFRSDVFRLDLVGKAESIGEAGAAAAVHRQSEDGRLALALRDRRDPRRGGWGKRDIAHGLEIGTRSGASKAWRRLCGGGAEAIWAAVFRKPERRMKISVYVTLKNGVLDPQGKAIHHALEGLGFSGVNDVRAGKLIELDVDESVGDSDVEEMCRKLLANMVIENFRIERQQPARDVAA